MPKAAIPLGHKGYTSYNLSLNQSVLNIPSWSALYNAKYNEKAAFYTTLAAWQDLCVRYTQAYLSQSLAQQTLSLDKRSQRITRQLYRLTQHRFKAGQIKSTDVSTVATSLLLVKTQFGLIKIPLIKKK